MITFKTHEVEIEAHQLPVFGAEATWKSKKLAPESYNHGRYLAVPLHPLVGAVGLAYNEHRPLSLSPDAIWTTIAQGLATHVKANAEELRAHFVKFEGKKYLEIQRNHFRKGSINNDWPGAFAEFSEMLKEHIGKKHDLIVAKFSTTTPTSQAASGLVLMDAMSSYFSFGMRTACGFPRITLEGTPDDWWKLVERVMVFDEFGLKWWTEHLTPVVMKLAETAEGKVDVEFWRSLYQEGGGSGGPYISGWINTLFPYLAPRRDKSPKNHALDWQKVRGMMSGLCGDSYPSALSTVPMKWHYFSQVFDMSLIGGLVGVEQAKDGTVSPGFGWAVADGEG